METLSNCHVTCFLSFYFRNSYESVWKQLMLWMSLDSFSYFIVVFCFSGPYLLWIWIVWQFYVMVTFYFQLLFIVILNSLLFFLSNIVWLYEYGSYVTVTCHFCIFFNWHIDYGLEIKKLLSLIVVIFVSLCYFM